MISMIEKGNSLLYFDPSVGILYLHHVTVPSQKGCWGFHLKLNQLKNTGGVEMLFDLQ